MLKLRIAFLLFFALTALRAQTPRAIMLDIRGKHTLDPALVASLQVWLHEASQKGITKVRLVAEREKFLEKSGVSVLAWDMPPFVGMGILKPTGLKYMLATGLYTDPSQPEKVGAVLYLYSLALFDENNMRPTPFIQLPPEFADPNQASIQSAFEALFAQLNQHPAVLEAEALPAEEISVQDFIDKAREHAMRGEYAQAIVQQQQAATLASQQHGENSQIYANTANYLGALYHSSGDLVRAEAYIKKAMVIREALLGKAHPDYALSLSNMARLYVTIGRDEEAAQYAKQSLDIRETYFGKNSFLYAVSLDDWASMKLNAAQDVDKVEGYFQEALAIYVNVLEEGDSNPDYASARARHNPLLNNLAFLYELQGRIGKAVTYYNMCMEGSKELFGEKSSGYIAALSNLARAFYIEGTKGTQTGYNPFEFAATYYKKALDLTKESLGDNHLSYAELCSEYGNVLAKGKSPLDAYPYFKKAIGISARQVQYTFPILSEQEKLAFYTIIRSNYNDFFQYAISQRHRMPHLMEQVYRYQTLSKGLILHETRKIRQAVSKHSDPSVKKNFDDWQDMRRQLAKLAFVSEEERQAKGIDFKELEYRANELEKLILQQVKVSKLVFFEDDPNIAYSIKANLKEKEAAVEIVRTYRMDYTEKQLIVEYLALIIHKKSPMELDYVLLENGRELESVALSFYSNAIEFKIEDADSYMKFWKPVQEKLDSLGIKKVYLAGEGIYNDISLGTLFIPEKGTHLIDEMEIHQLNNTKDLLKLKLKPSAIGNRKAVLFGRPDYDIEEKHLRELSEKADTTSMPNGRRSGLLAVSSMAFSDLPGTEAEVNGIGKLLNGKAWNVSVYMGKEATEEHLKKVSRPALLHIATHGFFITGDKDGVGKNQANANAMLRSGLVLTGVSTYFKSQNVYNTEDGVLTALEACDLNLEGTELVNLSACETGKGDKMSGEGVFGLQRALQIAGAKSVLMSLWKVSDQATQLLMNTFIEEWLATQDKRTAFKVAQKKVRETYPEPYYWGAFVMVGE